ncbi:MAG TPA: hypothetical protein VKF63_13815, partial [Terracidiphilus sp.]|nr:hypothetical protein [Terracidiphilus sp.]
MEPEIQPTQPEAPLAGTEAAAAHAPATAAPSLGERIFDWLNWTIYGSQGLRAGWLVLIFIILLGLIGAAVGFAFVSFHLVDFSKQNAPTA